MADEEAALFADPEIRAKLHEEAIVNKPDAAVGISKTWWNYIWVNEPVLEKNKWMQLSRSARSPRRRRRASSTRSSILSLRKSSKPALQAENNIDDEALLGF